MIAHLGKGTRFANVQEPVEKIGLAISRPLGNPLSKTMRDFWLHRATFGGFQGFTTDLRSMAKFSNSVKPNLGLYNAKVTLSLAPY